MTPPWLPKGDPAGGIAVIIAGAWEGGVRLERFGRVGGAPLPAMAFCKTSGSTRSWKSRRAVFKTLRKPTSVMPSTSGPSSTSGVGVAMSSLTAAAGMEVVIQAGTTIGSKPSSAAE